MCSCTCSVFFVRSLLHSSGGLLVCSLLFRAFVGPLVCSLFHSCIRKLIRWCVRELVRFFRAFAPSFFRWFTRVLAPFPCVRWSACFFALSFVHSLANSLVRSWARSFLCAYVRSLVHSCNHSFSVYSFVRWCARAHAFLFFVPLFGRSLALGSKAASSFFFFKVIWMI